MQWLLIALLVLLGLAVVLMWPFIIYAGGVVIGAVGIILMVVLAVWLWYRYTGTRTTT